MVTAAFFVDSLTGCATARKTSGQPSPNPALLFSLNFCLITIPTHITTHPTMRPT